MDKPTEKDYEELERLGAKLHIATPTAKWGFKLEKQDSDEVLYETIERAHSWVRNAYTILTCEMGAKGIASSGYGSGFFGIKNTSGTILDAGDGIYAPVAYSTVSSSNGLRTSGMGYIGAAGSAAIGIVIGTGTTPYSFEDYKLATTIGNGNGAGQMAYSAGVASDVWDGTSKVFTSSFTRIMNNNSGADITVSEVGLIGYFGTIGGHSGNFLTVRDLLETPIVVPTDSKLTITYNMQTLFPV